MYKNLRYLIFSFLIVMNISCTGGYSVVLNNLQEKEANIVVVFLESNGIRARKELVVQTGAAGGGDTSQKFNIEVTSSRTVEAMALLNQNGLPQTQGSTLLELFAKSGFMQSGKEETIRYESGLAQELANVILMIDGVIAANVQLSIPDPSEDLGGEKVEKRTTAAVFVKHQGVLDDPNNQLVLKIKRLISGSVQNLSLDDVTVVSDRARFAELSPAPSLENVSEAKPNEQIKIWSMTMNKNSTGTFRIIFFLLTSFIITFTLIIGWIIWKVYPIIMLNGGFTKMLRLTPYLKNKNSEESEEESSQENKE